MRLVKNADKPRILPIAIALVAYIMLASCALSVSQDKLSSAGSKAGVSQMASGGFNYGEALQKAIMFYDFQRSGPLPAGQRNNWRGDSGLNDEVLGGYHDAGDHVKFNLPMAFSASMMSWSLYENPTAYQTSGQTAYIQDAIKWVCDYLVGCQNAGYIYQIGDGGLDHAWWGPCEVMQMARPSAKSTQASAVMGQSAAALASASITLNNPAYLTAAKTFYSAAEAAKSDAGYTAANGYYNSWSGFYDELCWAGIWLYLATSDATYLTKATNYFTYVGMEGQSTNVAYKWTQSWDDSHYAAELMLARITGDPKYKTAIENNLDYWTTAGPDGTKVTYTPGGLAYLDTWGCIRYAMGESTLAFVYANWTGANPTKAATYKAFAERQVNYMLGSNPNSESYIIGFGTKYPQHPHHRTAESSWADSQTVPSYARHTIIGALVGGPDASDNFTDDDGQYQYTEPACDYNSCAIGALAFMYKSYGGTPVAGLNANETPSNVEYFVQTAQNSIGQNLFEVKFDLFNESGWPAKALSNSCSFRYFIDISELLAAGYTANDITLSVNYNQDNAGVATLKQWSGSIYYINVNWTGLIYPGGQSMYKKEIQVRFAYPTSVVNNNANDFSYQYFNNVVTLGTTNNPNVPVYINGVKVYGNEPGSTPISSTSSAPASSSSVASVATSSSAPATSSSSSAPISSSKSTVSSVATSSSSIAVSSSTSSTTSQQPGVLKIQTFQNGSATQNQVSERIQVVNTGTSAIALSTIKIHYFIKYQGNPNYNFACDYSPAGTANVTGVFAALNPAQATADAYNEIGFTSGAGSLAPGASVEIQGRFWKSDWSNIDNSLNYSYNPATAYVDWTKVTAYVNGSLVWGVEPNGSVASSSSAPVISSSSSAPNSSSSSSAPVISSSSTPVVSSSSSAPASSSSSSVVSSSSSSSSNGVVYTTITAPFTFDGAGTYHWKIASVPGYINDWNLSALTVNGTSFLNLYVSSSQLPAAQGGYYYIDFTGPYAWSHIEIK